MIARPVVFFIFILSGSRRMGGAYRSATQPLARFVFLSAAVCFCCCCGLEGIYTRGGAGAELRLMRQNGRRGEDSRHTVTVYMGGQSNT